MYDPTIFENLKVAFENHIYDLDNIDQEIIIQNREDRMDFATLARRLSIQFILVDEPEVTVELIVEASLEDLAGEILEAPGVNPGCSLLLRFQKQLNLQLAKQCEQIEQALHSIWEDDIHLTQTLSFVYGQDSTYMDNIEVKFKPKLTEEHMREIPGFLKSVLTSLEQLNRI
ncbi:hypothetical protein MUB24_15645 [Lederbergia sp. NSJ-179]|uniref:hypothetical protein n=1 Tax=Lederbergia sp. NSJ-179 TaxID=2931402 RepID=UPI001FD3F38D|nr:hypothetical protein [Lederbergia sp. NSJ-179]MCJ7842302.1 hypothetical protein [Lederbergia sp. NSJ-179]